MLKKWKKCFGKRKVFGDLLIELSKSFDCLNHTLLTARLNAYTFNNPVLRLINDYLSNIKQRIKLDNTHITWIETVFGNTEGSILRPLLFNIFLADLFFIISNTDIARYRMKIHHMLLWITLTILSNY